MGGIRSSIAELKLIEYSVLNACIINTLQNKYGLVAKVGIELEFYIIGDNQLLLNELAKNNIVLQQERGQNQFEFTFDYTNDIAKLSTQVVSFKEFISDLAKQQCNCEVSFAAKPFINDYGSALQLNISLHNHEEINIFSHHAINTNQDLAHCIAGILEISDEAVYLLCTKEEDYLRFIPNFLSPTHICWGSNNRTTVVRIPDSLPQNRRIEFRLPPADCNVEAAIFVSLTGVLHGLTAKSAPSNRVYGNAFKEEIPLKILPCNITEAKLCYEKGEKIVECMHRLLCC